MATASQVLRTAAAEVGYVEVGRNRTKYWADLKPEWQGSNWCAAYVQWVLKKNGMWYGAPLPYYVPSFVAKAKKDGTWRTASYIPKPGDLVIMGDLGRYQHIGFVEKSRGPGENQHLEGNTSSGVRGSQNNGEGVYRRIRTTSWVRGFIVMKYDKPTGYQLVPYPGHQHWIDGKDDHHVEQIQKRLTQLGFYKGQIDKRFGPKTDSATRAFQRSRKLSPDGFVGRRTWAALGIRSR